MNILVVAQTVPSLTSGAGARNYHLLKALARRHAVSLLALGAYGAQGDSGATVEGVSGISAVIAPAKAPPKRWQKLLGVLHGRPYVLDFYTLPAMQEAIDRACADTCFDLVLFESALMAGYRIPAGIQIVVDQHNLEYEVRLRTYRIEAALVRKWYNLLEGTMLRSVEIERCRRSAAVLVTSERERLLLQAALPGHAIEVVPNGVDVEAFTALPHVPEEPGRVIFTGSMDYYPNVQAVCYFAERCWPVIRTHLPAATWQIVGRNPPPEVRNLARLPGVTVSGAVPDLRPYLAAASVAIVPLLVGSGTRLKVLEAMAMRKAIVSTSLGCEGLSAVPGEHLEIADGPNQFAQTVVALLHDPGRRTALGSAGRALVEAAYDWERCGAGLLRVLERLAR